MYSTQSWPQTNGSTRYPPVERPASYGNGQPGAYSYSLVTNQTSRPSEPRPALPTSLSEASGISKREDPVCYHKTTSTDSRPRGQNLPGLRDILNTDRYSPPNKPYGSTWNASNNSNGTHQSPEGYPNLAGLHPPMALYPPTDASRYPTQSEKAYDVPMLATNPLPQQSQPFPLSPNPGILNAPRDYTDIRPDRPSYPSTGSYIPNGLASIYPPAAPNGHTSYRYPGPASYRSTRTSHLLSSTDIPGKYIGVEEVPGEGQFHIYENGHRIPTSVDGESVNPAWGLTKANKPRKRLALACLECREKKIKCEPGGANSCIQCEKAMRECRKAPEKFSQNEATTNTLWIAGSPVRKSASSSDPTPPSNRDTEPDPLNKRRAMADQSPPHGANKKHRSTSPRPDCFPNRFIRRDGTTPDEPVAWKPPSEAGCGEELTFEEDPYTIAPEITWELLELYFAHVNNAILCIFPRAHFFDWLQRYSPKCQNERLVLYAMFAAASVFADDRLRGFGKQCAQIAGGAIAAKIGRSNVAAAVSKILLAFYHFSKGANKMAWIYAGSAMRTVTFMNLNTEKGCYDDQVSLSQDRVEFAFSKEQLAECKRRTFWSVFLQDRFCGAPMCTIKPQDVFVRLPCADDMYERGMASDAPYFGNDIVDPASALLTPASPLAPMAWLVIVAAVWGDVCDFLFRASHRPSTTYAEAYELFYGETKLRLQGWASRLPEHLQYHTANLDRSIQQGYVDTFISMHTLYHFSLMKLSRYMRHEVMPDSIGRNVRAANHHGRQILLIMSTFAAAKREIATPASGQPKVCTFSTPFPGYATLSAIDVVSAGGLDSNLKSTLDDIDASMSVLRELANFWASAEDQHKACQKRHLQLENITKWPKGAKSGCWLGRKWGIIAALESEFEANDDCIYGLGKREADEVMAKYFDAFREEEGETGGLRIA